MSGWHRYYTRAELKAMYKNHARYVAKVINVIAPLVRQGYVLAYEAAAEIRDARHRPAGIAHRHWWVMPAVR